MYLNWARQLSEEFSALDTSCMAMSFLCGSVRSTARAAVGELPARAASITTKGRDAASVPAAARPNCLRDILTGASKRIGRLTNR